MQLEEAADCRICVVGLCMLQKLEHLHQAATPDLANQHLCLKLLKRNTEHSAPNAILEIMSAEVSVHTALLCDVNALDVLEMWELNQHRCNLHVGEHDV